MVRIILQKACSAEAAAGLTALVEAADAGYYYGETMLRDPDLDPLRGDLDFQRLSALFAERLAAAAAAGRPQLLSWAPSSTGPHALLVALHGNGSWPDLEAVCWQSVVGDGWLLAMPQSPQLVSHNRFGWNDMDRAAPEVADHFAALVGDPARSVVCGFSRGAALAVRLALLGEAPVQGFIAVAPSIRVEAVRPLVNACQSERVHGCILVGDQDFAYPAAQELATAMRERSLTCELVDFPGLGHDYPPDFAAVLRQKLLVYS